MLLRAHSLWVVLALLLTGCGGKGNQIAPVSGRVMLDGKPLSDATVSFVPVLADKEQAPPPSSVGTTNKDGEYSLVLNSAGNSAGAVVGKHTVIITIGGGGSKEGRVTYHKQLPERYNRKTELECDVPAEGRTDANFDLKSQ